MVKPPFIRREIDCVHQVQQSGVDNTWVLGRGGPSPVGAGQGKKNILLKWRVLAHSERAGVKSLHIIKTTAPIPIKFCTLTNQIWL